MYRFAPLTNENTLVNQRKNIIQPYQYKKTWKRKEFIPSETDMPKEKLT